ncbi:MAG: FemAB family XrtA/PEP-CTERM system-associated protein [Acetobacteraceae bacterium]
MRVLPFTGPAAAWDQFVRSMQGHTHFHLHGWKTVLERSFGHECLYLAAEQDGVLAGVLPLVRVKSRLFGHFLVSMPFLNYGGPLGSDEAVGALAARAVQIADRDRAKLLEFRSRFELPIEMAVSHRKVTVLLDLPGDGDALWKAFPSKRRGQVRRPMKEGVTVRFGADQVRPFFAIFAEHMRDLGTPTQSLRLFEAIAEIFPDSSLFACAYLGEEPVGCGAGFTWAEEFEISWSASPAKYKPIAPNMLLYARLMESCVERGVRVFNFGRSTPGSGTHHFKMQWGAREQSLWWYSHQGAGRGAAQTTPNPDDPAYAWGPRLWKRLPVGVATTLGPMLARSIP